MHLVAIVKEMVVVIALDAQAQEYYQRRKKAVGCVGNPTQAMQNIWRRVASTSAD